MGAGLAGACAAAWLSREREVVLLDAAVPASGASGASAGLVNPFPGRRAAPAWRHAEAVDALRDLVAMAGAEHVFRRDGLLRPAGDADQAAAFRERARAHLGEVDWLDAAVIAERWPAVRALHGGIWVEDGGAVDIPALVEILLGDKEVRIETRVVDAGEDGDGAWVETSDGERLEAGVVLLAPGDGFRHIPLLAELPLGRIKGQTVRLAAPEDALPLPLIAGHGYVVPEGEALVAGSTYDRSFDGVEPSEKSTREIMQKVSRMVPSLERADVLDARAGVRVTVPPRLSRRRLPMVGPLPGRRRLWILLGLGSKGLLTAPLLSGSLPAWLEDPDAIPEEVRVRIDGAGRT